MHQPLAFVPTSQGVGSVVIGAGPYGLAAATHLTARGVEHRVFGTPMAGWFEHMPIGMFLKSTARDSSIGSPHQKIGIGDWCEAASVEPFDKGGAEIPIPVNDFIEYGRWFRGRRSPRARTSEGHSHRQVDNGIRGRAGIGRAGDARHGDRRRRHGTVRQRAR